MTGEPPIHPSRSGPLSATRGIFAVAVLAWLALASVASESAPLFPPDSSTRATPAVEQVRAGAKTMSRELAEDLLREKPRRVFLGGKFGSEARLYERARVWVVYDLGIVQSVYPADEDD
jgi:hypothetical protein